MKTNKMIGAALLAVALLSNVGTYAAEDRLRKEYDGKKAAKNKAVDRIRNTIDNLVENDVEQLEVLSEQADRLVPSTSRFSHSSSDFVYPNDDIVRIYSVDSAQKLKATQIAHRLHYTLAENGIVAARAAAETATACIFGFAGYKASKNNSGSTARNTAAAVVAGAFGFKAAKSIVEEYAPVTLAELVEEKEKRFVRVTGRTDSQSIVRALCKGRFMFNMDIPSVMQLTAYKHSQNYQANLNQVNSEFQLYTNQGIRLMINPREEFLEHLVNYREVLNPLLERAKTHSMLKSKVSNCRIIYSLIDQAEKDIDTYKTLFAMSLEEQRNRRQNLGQNLDS